MAELSEMMRGIILTAISAAGVIGCISGLIATAVLFPKQRKRLLEKIEEES